MTASAQAILSQLKDIHQPKAISMWPDTLAWYVLLVMAVVIMLFCLYRLINFFLRKQKQKPALKLLRAACGLYPQNQSLALQQISKLLRRITFTRYARKDTASLHGESWLRFLDEISGCNEFSNGVGKLLIDAPYRKDSQVPIEKLEKLITRLIKRVL